MNYDNYRLERDTMKIVTQLGLSFDHRSEIMSYSKEANYLLNELKDSNIN